jgi:predicted DCC family thiol-disulfide oxidoreductase YuxK
MTPDLEREGAATDDAHARAHTATGELPAILGGWRSPPAKFLARLAALPIRAVATTRPVAVANPDALHPGDAPGTGDKLLLIFDGGCGICLHARDVFAVLDRRHRLTFDRIARHDAGLLADLTEDERYGSWHVIHPDGRAEHGSDGVAAAVGALPGGRWLERGIRRWPGPPDAGYRWFARNRGWISRGSA